MNRLALTLLVAALPCLLLASELPRSSSPEGAAVSFAHLKDGDTVATTFTVEFELTGMDVVPAGTEAENSGHHHLLIDLDELPPMNLPLPKTDHVQHFGAGQTTAELTLPPGEHTLQLLLGDYLHIPHDPPVMSQQITVYVPES